VGCLIHQQELFGFAKVNSRPHRRHPPSLRHSSARVNSEYINNTSIIHLHFLRALKPGVCAVQSSTSTSSRPRFLSFFFPFYNTTTIFILLYFLVYQQPKHLLSTFKILSCVRSALFRSSCRSCSNYSTWSSTRYFFSEYDLLDGLSRDSSCLRREQELCEVPCNSLLPSYSVT
jgi:hypothetical protein